MNEMTKTKIELTPIGRVDTADGQGPFRLLIEEAYRPALQGLGSCTHAIVLWWADQAKDEDLVVELPYAPGVKSGVFANRSESRPNPIAITTTIVLNVDEDSGTVDLAWIDAFDDTPVLDIKPYMPMSDRVMDAQYPEWLDGFPESMEDAAAFFSDPANAEKFS
jgi:tRNA-Thr(GGU) m(6)t(6)A37 methyltransferase TsaA